MHSLSLDLTLLRVELTAVKRVGLREEGLWKGQEGSVHLVLATDLARSEVTDFLAR